MGKLQDLNTSRSNLDKVVQYGKRADAIVKNMLLHSHVEIKISDDGTGIQPDVKEKMFNSFFTTKPAEKAPASAFRSVTI
jgi:signal transduction histidine kinase